MGCAATAHGSLWPKTSFPCRDEIGSLSAQRGRELSDAIGGVGRE